MSQGSSETGLSLAVVREFRQLLRSHQRQLQYYSQTSDTAKEVLLELHNLAVDVEDVFNTSFLGKDNQSWEPVESIATPVKSKLDKPREFHGQVYISKDNGQAASISPLRHQSRLFQKEAILDEDYDKEERQCNRLSIKSQYRDAMANIRHLQKQRRSLLSRLEISEKKLEGVAQQKKYCLDLLNRNSVKESDLQIENKVLRNENRQLSTLVKQLQEQSRRLAECDHEKSLLLKDIDDFLTSSSLSRPASRWSGKQSRVRDQNSKLMAYVVQYQQQAARLSQQNSRLQQVLSNNQAEIGNLLSKNQELLNDVCRLQQQNSSLILKNQELINIEESKKLNQIVHRQNRHLLQVNYELGNKLHTYERQVEGLILRVMELEGETSSKGAETPTYEQYAISTDPFVGKGVCFEESPPITKAKSITQIKYSAHDTINRLNIKLKNQADLNSELQNKIEELLDQLYVCQQSIFEKEKQIANLNISLNHSQSTQNIATNRLVQSRQEQQNSQKINGRTGNQQQLQNQNDEVLTLEEFVQKFQPSLMDTLFIMLRITEIAVAMLQEGRIKTIAPSDLLLQLDDPSKPQDIIVQLRSKRNSEDNQTTQLYESPQMIVGQQSIEASVVWNVGMVFYYLICKQPYFKSVESIQEAEDIEFSRNLPGQVEAIVEYSLRRNPQDRISLNQMLEGISEEINNIFSQS